MASLCLQMNPEKTLELGVGGLREETRKCEDGEADMSDAERLLESTSTAKKSRRASTGGVSELYLWAQIRFVCDIFLFVICPPVYNYVGARVHDSAFLIIDNTIQRT